MANFNINDYDTVESRIRKLYELYPDARIVTEWIDFAQDEKGPWRWCFKASIYLDTGDQAAKLPKAVGYATEVELGKQAEWAAELAETSSIGRALANMNMSGNKRASREEMQKVIRAESKANDWSPLIEKLNDRDSALQLFNEARTSGAPKSVLDAITAKGKSFV
jgi:hypothetical protein